VGGRQSSGQTSTPRVVAGRTAGVSTDNRFHLFVIQLNEPCGMRGQQSTLGLGQAEAILLVLPGANDVDAAHVLILSEKTLLKQQRVTRLVSSTSAKL
jgi:hypothetical protein